MNKQSLFPMSNEIALEFILHVIKPNNPPLGMPFGWIQPNDETTITLGSIYVQTNLTLSLKDLIYGQYPYNWRNINDVRTNYEFIFPPDYDTYNLRQAIKTFGGSDKKQKIQGIWECENIHCQYSELKREERLLYHLAIMALNTMTECHNWSISYLEYLAYNHYSLKEHGNLWHIYEDSNNDDICQAISELIPDCSNIPDELGFYSYTIDNNQNDECYNYFNQWNDENTDIQEWIKSLIEDTNILDQWDIRDYDSEIIGTLAAMIEWIKSSWQDESLTMAYSDNMPRQLKAWYRNFESQMILPGLENTP